MKTNKPNFCNQLNRREFLKDIGGGFAALGLTGMLAQDGFFASKAMARVPSLSTRSPPSQPRCPPSKISHLFVHVWGPSHMDTFDYKPELYPLDGKTIQVKLLAGEGTATKAGWLVRNGNSNSMASVGNMFRSVPSCGECVDDIAFFTP